MKRVMRLGLLLLSVFMLICFPSLADSNTPLAEPGLKNLGNIGALTNAVAVDNNFIYIANGSSVILLKKTGEGLDSKGFQFNLPEEVTDLKADSDMLYAAAGSAGVYIIDVKNPSKPIETGLFKSDGCIEAIEVRGSTLYAADSMKGLLVVDISEPAKPVLTAQAFKGKTALAFDFYDDAVYIAAGNDGFLVADISKPGLPREAGSFKTPGYARDVALWGGYAYIADDAEGICIADIAGAPCYLDSIKTQGHVYGLQRYRNGLYAADLDKGLKVFDISIPYKINEISCFHSEGARLVQTVISADTAYCVDLQNGIICLDIRDPSNLKRKETNNTVLISQVELMKPAPLPSAPPINSLPPVASTPPSSQSGDKVAYITIDDGPSNNNTPQILDILYEYGIHATFFVLPNDKAVDIYKRIMNEGHVIGNHSYSHDYDYLYSSLDNFKKDILKARTYIFNKLNYTSTVFRFPGGAMGKNKDMINKRVAILKELGYTWFDWNASTGDADPYIKKYGDEEDIVRLLINNVLNHTYTKKKLIVLMHDSYPKTYTVKALPQIIEGLIKQGYRFDVLINY